MKTLFLSLSMSFLAMAASFVGAAQEQIVIKSGQLNGVPMHVKRTRLSGEVVQVSERIRRQWLASGTSIDAIRANSSGSWTVLSRPGTTGLEVVQIQKKGQQVEIVASQMPLPRPGGTAQLKSTQVEKIDDYQSRLAADFNMRALFPMVHKDDRQFSISGVFHWEFDIEHALAELRRKLIPYGWKEEFFKSMPSGHALMLRGPSDERVVLTIHGHRGGSALVFTETRKLSRNE